MGNSRTEPDSVALRDQRTRHTTQPTSQWFQMSQIRLRLWSKEKDHRLDIDWMWLDDVRCWCSWKVCIQRFLSLFPPVWRAKSKALSSSASGSASPTNARKPSVCSIYFFGREWELAFDQFDWDSYRVTEKYRYFCVHMATLTVGKAVEWYHHTTQTVANHLQVINSFHLMTIHEIIFVGEIGAS